ncbi:hypothetical protein K490DRAFT_69272 [Saccharata proteae CBS 121410]|uniref:Uncharacterized protein n=1 Tax=Saccharata proteae CBS 121410 TaxID=1314787 RepID=A0A9P4LRW3_9PEZI|nr:hypothetical protein K490DRAFT_69272 [Saccharata proteae CBS 121410]
MRSHSFISGAFIVLLNSLSLVSCQTMPSSSTSTSTSTSSSSFTSSPSSTSTSTTSTDRTCYYPNGVQSNASPCFPDQPVSACCGPGFICYSDGLCAPGPEDRRTYQYKIYRSGCTDRSWNSSSCPSVCLGTDDNLEAGQGIATCGESSFCCGRDYDCCGNSSNIFTYGNLDIATTIPYNKASSTSTPSPPSTSTSASASVPTSSQSSPSASNNSVAIGVGVGVGIGGAILLSATLILLHRLRSQRRQRTNPDFSPPSHQRSAEGGTGAPPPPPPPPPPPETRELGHPPDYDAALRLQRQRSRLEERSPVSPDVERGGGGMVAGWRLNPAEMEAVEHARYEMEEVGSWKGGKGGIRHELEG